MRLNLFLCSLLFVLSSLCGAAWAQSDSFVTKEVYTDNYRPTAVRSCVFFKEYNTKSKETLYTAGFLVEIIERWMSYDVKMVRRLIGWGLREDPGSIHNLTYFDVEKTVARKIRWTDFTAQMEVIKARLSDRELTLKPDTESGLNAEETLIRNLMMARCENERAIYKEWVELESESVRLPW